YGNELGTPGTIMTTFPYKGKGVPEGQKGAGQITATSFSVPGAALEFWRRRLAAHGIRISGEGTRFGEDFLTFNDPAGLVAELIAGNRDQRAPWTTDEIGPAAAIRGVSGITMTIRAPKESLALLTDVLGFETIAQSGNRTRLAVNDDAPGKTIDILHAPEAPGARNGLGTVHHVALAVPDPEDQVRMRAELLRLGYSVTQVLDRQYFHSIYFREPGGVLFEIATVPPGFTVDENPADLGRGLKLPPWEEPQRAAIEAALPRLA
ncbi:MAG: ring-cleaving dioxygenase, partial [Gemmatimonadales bacterium]